MDNDSQRIQREVFQTPPWTTCAARSVPEPSGQRMQREVFSDPSLDNACSEKYSRPLPGQRVQREVFQTPPFRVLLSLNWETQTRSAGQQGMLK